MASEENVENKDEEATEFGPSIIDDIRRLKQEFMKMDKEVLADRLAAYEYIIPKLGSQVQWCINNYYKPIYFRFRMGRDGVGLLVGAVLVPEMLILLAEEEVSRYAEGKTYVRRDIRLVHAPIKELTYYDVVLEQGQWEEKESYY